MTYKVTCPLKGYGKAYDDCHGLRDALQVERSFRMHLTGKHCSKGKEYDTAVRTAKRVGYMLEDLVSEKKRITC
jgi:hypothetical protein